jgi:hypothetical protein
MLMFFVPLLLALTASTIGDEALPDPGNLVEYRGRNGETFRFLVRTVTGGGAWGTDIYTDDSMLATAAIHSGALGYGETGVVEVTMLPGGDSYPGSTRYGVTTDSCGPWHGSYSVAATRAVVDHSGAVSDRRSSIGGLIIPAFIIPGALWLLLSATSRRPGVLYRAYFSVYIGILAAAVTVFFLLSSGASGGWERTTLLLLFSFAIACVLIGAAGLVISRSNYPFTVSRHANVVSSMGAVGIAVFWVAAFLLLGGPLSRFIRETGLREAAREIPGTGVSRRATSGFHSMLLPFLLFLVGLVNTFRVGSVRNRIAEKLMDPQPAKLHMGYLLLGLFSLVMFITCSSEFGLFRL